MVSDDGICIQADLDIQSADKLGLGLVKEIVEKQLKGSFSMESKKGTKFTLKFR